MSKLRNITAYVWQGSLVRRANVVLGAVAVGLVTACSVGEIAGPAAPAGAPAAAIASAASTTSGSMLFGVTALKRNAPLAQPITRSITLLNQGGTLAIPEAGLTVVIPRTAIGDTAVTISATALAGGAVAYDFQPHGSKFAAQLQVKQDLSTTSWASNTGRATLIAGYFANNSQLNTSTGAATINERLNATLTGGMLMYNVSHFSGYLVAWASR